MFEFVFPGNPKNKPQTRKKDFEVRIPAKSASKANHDGMFAPKTPNKDMTMAILLK